MEADCVYYHTDKICDKFLANGKCEQGRWCLNRHPKDCKFWLGDPQGCLRGQICKYLHKIENKGKNVKVLESNSDVSDKASEKVKVFSIKATHDDKKDTENKSDEQNHDKMGNVEDIEVDMEDKISPIYDIDHNSRVKIDTLESENASLKEQLENLKRVVLTILNQIRANKKAKVIKTWWCYYCIARLYSCETSFGMSDGCLLATCLLISASADGGPRCRICAL